MTNTHTEVTEVQKYILEEMADWGDYCYGYWKFDIRVKNKVLVKKELQKEMKGLLRMGIVNCVHGLMNDDGEVCGSGFEIAYQHRHVLDKIVSNIEDITPSTHTEVREIDRIVPCIQSGCDQNGTIAERDSEGDWQPAPCQYCHEVRLPLRDFITDEIDKAKADRDGEWRERLNKLFEDRFHWGKELSDDVYITEKEFGEILSTLLEKNK